MKGLQVCRNDNYSNDSYQKDESDSQDGIITYQLNKLPKEDYPEKEWFSTKMINARLEVSASNCPEVTLHTKNGKLIGSNNGINHHFVF